MPNLMDALAPFVVRGELLVTVNRKVGSLDSVVKDGDVLKISHQSRASYDGTTDIPT
jgi:molybdopterin synthase sulfur carrier subunit